MCVSLGVACVRDEEWECVVKAGKVVAVLRGLVRGAGVCLFDVFLQREGKERERVGGGGGRRRRRRRRDFIPLKQFKGNSFLRAMAALQFSTTPPLLCCRSHHSAGDEIPARTELIDGSDATVRNKTLCLENPPPLPLLKQKPL